MDKGFLQFHFYTKKEADVFLSKEIILIGPTKENHRKLVFYDAKQYIMSLSISIFEPGFFINLFPYKELQP
jgi:hypothetical protein